MPSKSLGQATLRAVRPEVRDDPDEIALAWEEGTDQRWVALTARFVAVVTEHLKRHHEIDVVTALPGGARVDGAAGVVWYGGSSLVKATNRTARRGEIPPNSRDSSSNAAMPLALSSAPGLPETVS